MAVSDHKFMILQINGPDRPGLFTKFCTYLYDQNINIEDVSQNVLRGFLAITFLLNITRASMNKDRLQLGLNQLARELGIHVSIFDYVEGQRSRIRDLYFLNFMGPDQSGILAKVSKILADYEANIDTIHVIQRGQWLYTQLLLDLRAVKDIAQMRNDIRKQCQLLNLSMVLQKEDVYRKNKKLIVFDMDSTLIQGETLVEIAKKLNKHADMEHLTEITMATDQNFETSLRERAKLIAGVSVETLLDIANNIEITPGADELVKTLKEMGWKIALISSGFSLFTDKVKEKLDLDYSFGNTLEIIDGKTTGNVLGKIIDAEGKWLIVQELMAELNLTKDEVISIGDGSNDRVMLKNSGLGIGLNSKEILSVVADGRIRIEDVNMILLMLGLSETEIERLLSI